MLCGIFGGHQNGASNINPSGEFLEELMIDKAPPNE